MWRSAVVGVVRSVVDESRCAGGGSVGVAVACVFLGAAAVGGCQAVGVAEGGGCGLPSLGRRRVVGYVCAAGLVAGRTGVAHAVIVEPAAALAVWCGNRGVVVLRVHELPDVDVGCPGIAAEWASGTACCR